MALLFVRLNELYMSLFPQLCFVTCSALSSASPERRMAYWDWSAQEGGDAGHAVICVHGLSRQGRDFDVLAQHLSSRVRVICPDVAGRGQSDWLTNSQDYQIPTYAKDMAVLLAELRRQGVHTIDWVGTSMGGLIGMVLASLPGASGLQRLVLNDVGPAVQTQALLRIANYLGLPKVFASQEEGFAYLLGISGSFGPHTSEQWAALSTPMLKLCNGGWQLHYDPAIALPFKALTHEAAAASAAQVEAAVWSMYDSIKIPTLLIRGAASDLLTPETAYAMTERGPKAKLVEFSGIGHAPTLIARDQLAAVADFLWDEK
jgi:pimeloyl-ACP methyl ester carboxylesterase